MLKSRVLSVVLIFSLLAGLPVSVLASAEPAPAAPTAPVVSTVAAPLSPAELAQYAQLQADAQQAGALDAQRGGAKNDDPWLIVGVVAVVIIAAGLTAAIVSAD